MTMKYEPSASPRSKMDTTFGCERPAACVASRRNRSTNCASLAYRSWRILIATLRPSSWSSASQTSAMPPEPSLRSSRYRPAKIVPRLSSMVAMSLRRLGVTRRTQDCLQDLARDRRGGLAAGRGLVLERDRDRDLRPLPLAAREGDEPRRVDARPAGLGRAGLPTDPETGDPGRRPRACLDDADHHVLDLLRVDRPDRTVEPLGARA